MRETFSIVPCARQGRSASPLFPHMRKTGCLSAAYSQRSRARPGCAQRRGNSTASARSSKTLYGEDGPHTLVGEGKGGPSLWGARSSRGFWRRVQASRAADAALAPTPQIVSRVQAANIFRLLLVIGSFPFLFSVCRSLQTITRKITSNAKRTPKPTHAARVELAPTSPTRLNAPPFVIVPCLKPLWRLAISPSFEISGPLSSPVRNPATDAIALTLGKRGKPAQSWLIEVCHHDRASLCHRVAPRKF